jgi:hypothetical protein
VDLAISGSKTSDEAARYDEAAPYFSNQRFSAYSGNRPISLALLWGGTNDQHHGGDLATGSPVSATNLSPFQRGVYDQITKIFSRSPHARIGLLQYVDPVFGTPDWKPAYMQVESLFPEIKRKQMFLLAVYDPPGASNACDVDPKGHPSAAMHEAWATQIFSWLVANNLLLN